MSQGQWGGGPPQGPGSGWPSTGQPQQPTQGWGQPQQSPAQPQAPAQGWGLPQQQAPGQPAPQGYGQQPQGYGAPAGQPGWGAPGAQPPGQSPQNAAFPHYPTPTRGGLGIGRIAGGAGAAIGIALVAIVKAGVLGGLGGFGTHTRQDTAVDNITGAFRNGMARPDLASQVCGYRVSGLQNVTLANVDMGGLTLGQATAIVTGTPLPGGAPIQTPSCSRNCAFHYTINNTRGGRYTRGFTNTDVTDMHFYVQLAPGEVANGMLGDGDPMLTDHTRVYVDYGIQLTAGQPITIVVRGGRSSTNARQSLDTMVAVFNRLDQQLADNDDIAPNNLNSRVVFTPIASGLHYIRVTTAAGDPYGNFQVQTFPGNVPNAQ